MRVYVGNDSQVANLVLVVDYLKGLCGGLELGHALSSGIRLSWCGYEAFFQFGTLVPPYTWAPMSWKEKQMVRLNGSAVLALVKAKLFPRFSI